MSTGIFFELIKRAVSNYAREEGIGTVFSNDVEIMWYCNMYNHNRAICSIPSLHETDNSLYQASYSNITGTVNVTRYKKDESKQYSYEF